MSISNEALQKVGYLQPLFYDWKLAYIREASHGDRTESSSISTANFHCESSDRWEEPRE